MVVALPGVVVAVVLAVAPALATTPVGPTPTDVLAPTLLEAPAPTGCCVGTVGPAGLWSTSAITSGATLLSLAHASAIRMMPMV